MTDTKRPLSNPLALAVLVLLYERPMHPYEMASTMRERRKEASIRLNYGSLYTVIEQLLREKLIAVREVRKEGRRPEKTVYELRPSGEVEMIDWMRELVSSPVKEYPMFEAALTLLPVLPPEEVMGLFEIRVGLLKKTLDEIALQEKLAREMKLPRLFSLEVEYFKALTLAEYKHVQDLLADLKGDKGQLRSGWSKLRKQLRAMRAGGTKQLTSQEILTQMQKWNKKHERKKDRSVPAGTRSQQ